MARSKLPIIDTDLHHHFRSAAALEPYLPEGVGLPYFGGAAQPHGQGQFRDDTVSPRGGLPASDPEFVVEHLLDRYGYEYAILSCGSTLGLGNLPDTDLASTVATATNDWTINEWFPVDDRFLGAIFVSLTDPDRAADEIRRLGSNPRMVSVVTTNAPCFFGHSFLDPDWEACAELGLPFTLHPGGKNIAAGGAMLGPHNTFGHFRTSMCFYGIEQMMSLVWDGVFVRYPNLRYVSNEWGVAWLPFILWKMDMEYRETREEVPWLTKLPSEYVREHVRFTTQPVDEPRDPKDTVTLLSLVDADELLMFSSDYPHHDCDNPEVAFHAFPEDWQRRIFFDNAWDWYSLGERLGAERELAAGVA
jgi:predicted TIM-barrel fold metal-dependent hydrolase